MEPDTAPLGTGSIEYDRSTDEEGRLIGSDDNGVDSEANRPRERVGFRLNSANKTIDYQVGADNWQALTDKEVLEVTAFQLDVNNRVVDVPCGAGPCPVLGAGGCALKQIYRDVTINIAAKAHHDAAVQRALRDQVRLRNSELREVCPPLP
jgi:hypothetical protein